MAVFKRPLPTSPIFKTRAEAPKPYAASPPTRILQSWDDLPLWQQKLDTKFILTGYRPEANSIVGCFKTWLYLHNETVNIWTHVTGACLFLVGLPQIWQGVLWTPRSSPKLAEIVVFSIYFAGVAACFILSTIFHTIYHHSERASRIGVNLDFLGVALLMFSASVPLIYYQFLDYPGLRTAYWSIAAALTLSCSYFTMHDRFGSPLMAHLRVSTFAGLALASVLPVLHGIWKFGAAEQRRMIGLDWVLLTVVIDALASAAYITKFPEKRYPRAFDIFGASHQIMHVLVVLASSTFAVALVTAFRSRHAI